nr:hypothetical protein [Trichocoleus desertorum]
MPCSLGFIDDAIALKFISATRTMVFSGNAQYHQVRVEELVGE